MSAQPLFEYKVENVISLINSAVLIERVKPTEDAILEMVRLHYSYKSNKAKRPRTKRTSKTWWSNAKLIVFSDPTRTYVFAWQWPKDGYRSDGQNGFNNTLFHRSNRCPYQASDVILAAEQAVIQKWGESRAYTYIDPKETKSNHIGYCYKLAGWRNVRNADGTPYISKSGKYLFEKQLTEKI